MIYYDLECEHINSIKTIVYSLKLPPTCIRLYNYFFWKKLDMIEKIIQTLNIIV